MKVIYPYLILILFISTNVFAQDEFYNRIGWSKKQVSSYHYEDDHSIEDLGSGPMHFYQMDSHLKVGYVYNNNRVIRVILRWSGLSENLFYATMEAIKATLAQGGFKETGKSEKKALFGTIELKNYNRKVDVMMIRDQGSGRAIIVTADKR